MTSSSADRIFLVPLVDNEIGPLEAYRRQEIPESSVTLSNDEPYNCCTASALFIKRFAQSSAYLHTLILRIDADHIDPSDLAVLGGRSYGAP